MSTVTAFPAAEAAAPQPPAEPHPAPELAPHEPISSEPASWRETVLDLLAQGASVVDAMRHVGYSSAAFYKACNRHPEFRAQAACARNAYRAQVAEEFHDAEAYARMLVDSVMRDEQLPASLRLRAALSILNRKGDHWLPGSIAVNTVDTIDILDNSDTLGYAATIGSVDNVDTVDHVETMDTVDTVGNMDTVADLDTANAADNADTMDKMDRVDTVDTVDTVSTIDTMDNLANAAYRQFLAEIEAMDSAFYSALSAAAPAEPASSSTPENTMDNMDTTDTGIATATPRAAHKANPARQPTSQPDSRIGGCPCPEGDGAAGSPAAFASHSWPRCAE